METIKTLATLTLLSAATAQAQQAFYGDPPDDNHPWAVHDQNRPQPVRVGPGKNNAPPSDAVVLFGGNDLEQNWVSAKKAGGPAKWDIVDGIIQCKPGYLTVFCNGVLVQDHTPLEGGGGHKGRSKPRAFPEMDSLKLQDHGNTTRFRNIWYRPLPPRSVEGGTNGKLTPEATAAKRKEIAASIREDAKKMLAEGNEKDGTMRLLESLVYENDDATRAEATQLAELGMDDLQNAPADKLESIKGEIIQVKNAFAYLTKHKILPADFAPKAAIGKIIADQGWNKKK